MNSSRIRISLVIIYLGGLVLNLILAYYTYWRGVIYSEDLLTISLSFLSTFSVPLGIVFTGLFATRKLMRRQCSPVAAWTAIAVSTIWSILLLFRTGIFAFSEVDNIVDMTDYIKQITAGSNFLVAGALTFFFSGVD